MMEVNFYRLIERTTQINWVETYLSPAIASFIGGAFAIAATLLAFDLKKRYDLKNSMIKLFFDLSEQMNVTIVMINKMEEAENDCTKLRDILISDEHRIGSCFSFWKDNAYSVQPYLAKYLKSNKAKYAKSNDAYSYLKSVMQIVDCISKEQESFREKEKRPATEIPIDFLKRERDKLCDLRSRLKDEGVPLSDSAQQDIINPQSFGASA